MMSEKVGPQHPRRKAILYVRQSSPHQVMHNRESGTLQHAMTGRLKAFCFSQIEVVDEDLGQSAAGAVARAGFDRMVAEVCLGKVGAVAAHEVSRFARNSRSGHLFPVGEGRRRPAGATRSPTPRPGRVSVSGACREQAYSPPRDPLAHGLCCSAPASILIGAISR